MEENFKSHLNEYPVSFTNFRFLIDMVKVEIDSVSLALQVTDNVTDVVRILENNYSLLSRTIKLRFTGVKKINDCLKTTKHLDHNKSVIPKKIVTSSQKIAWSSIRIVHNNLYNLMYTTSFVNLYTQVHSKSYVDL